MPVRSAGIPADRLVVEACSNIHWREPYGSLLAQKIGTNSNSYLIPFFKYVDLGVGNNVRMLRSLTAFCKCQ